jgi:hypothetical protein
MFQELEAEAINCFFDGPVWKGMNDKTNSEC